jgi:16S rRNA processing protein RimM
MSSTSSKTNEPVRPVRDDLPETVAVGRVLRPHGVRGEVVVEAISDVPGRFDAGSVLLATREGKPGRPLTSLPPLTVAAGRPHKSGALVRFAGIDDRDRAEELRGVWLEVPRSQVPAAEPGTYYQYELLGCRCFSGGEELGRVEEVVEDGGGLLLIVAQKGDDGERRIPVPFVREFLMSVDVAGGTIELELPPGLLEVCASTS